MTDGPSLMPFTIIAVGFPAVWCAWIYKKKKKRRDGAGGKENSGKKWCERQSEGKFWKSCSLACANSSANEGDEEAREVPAV